MCSFSQLISGRSSAIAAQQGHRRVGVQVDQAGDQRVAGQVAA
jgi:hypothetical protein